jgi:hypothetical protein
MTKIKQNEAPPTMEWAQRITDALKADFMAVVNAVDWSGTPEIEHAFVENHLARLDELAIDMTTMVARAEKEGQKLRARLQRFPALPASAG